MQDTEQIHGKQGSGALLIPLPLFLVAVCSLSTLVACRLVIATVGCESGTSAKLVVTSVRLVGLRVWNGKLVGTSEELVAGGDSKVADCPLVAGRDVKSQSVP